MSFATEPLTLLFCLLLLLGIASLVWLAMGGVARLAPRAAYLLAAANASAIAALGWHGLPAQAGLPDWPGDLLLLAAFALLHAAVPAITRRAPAWRTAAAVLLLATPLLILLPAGDLRWQTRLLCIAVAGLMLWSGVDAWQQMRLIDARQRRGLLAPTPLTLPLLLTALLAAWHGVQAWLPGDSGASHARLDAPLLLASFVLAVLQNATLAFLVLRRLILRLEHLIDHDPLTQVLNRRAFTRALAAAQAGWRRGRGYALVMIDMDHFKRLNDDLGHAAGDAALQQMAGTVQPCLREVDRLGRLGGEEFCVLLPLTDLAGAALVAERMRALIGATPLRWQERDWPLSASFGIAEAEPGDASAEAVMARADAAMYRAKGQGRNVVQP